MKETAEVRLIASSQNWIEGAAVQQLEKTASLPGMRLAVGLPDLHPGKGSPIGAAFAVEGYLYPALVGNDIGCGIGLWRTELGSKRLQREAWADRLRNLDDAWDGDARQFLGMRGIEPSGYEHSLGTIGGGNHFAELQSIESVQNTEACQQLGIGGDAVFLCVHSGSRGFGEGILREHVAQFGFGGLAVETGEAAPYLTRHDHARRWAAANRELIAVRVFERLRTEGVRLVDICHNWVEQVDLGGHRCWLHRKGAAPSNAGPVVIPGSRGAFTYLVAPKDPGEKSAFSLAHGAGRKWSRSDSRARLEKRFSAKDLTRTALGSHVICEDKALLYEEAPQAYKNITIVIDDLVKAGLVEVLAVLKPLVTYKVRR
ncbi:MAG TPA: RNA ligase RtcB family protein [Bryobacteraceae bacterium]|nr:RNA ligase RtcB family protein [Bryobacteraceae bacterium]